MRRDSQLNNIKNYSQHLMRLANIRLQSISSKKSNQISKTNLQSRHKSSKGRRYLTQSVENKKNIAIALPLVAQTERELLSKSLSVCKIPHRDAQILLENYLLNKRLLRVKPSIKRTEQDKDYQNHYKYSHLRSKSKLSEIKLSKSRLLKFKQFEIAQKRKLSSKLPSHLGSGKFIFSFKMTSFQKLNKKQDRNGLYNLTLKIGSRSFTYKHLSFKNYNQNRSFYFRKKDLKYPNLLFGEIDSVVQNENRKIGNFTVDLNDAYNKLTMLQKEQEFNFEREDEVEGITTSRSQLLVGTITFNYSITKTYL